MAEDHTVADATEEQAAPTETATTVREQRRQSPPGEDATVEEWKQYARAWEDRAKSASGDKTAAELKRERKAREDLERQLREREDADKTEHERQLDQARKEAADTARAEVTGQVRARLLKAEIKALAATTFADPEDAHRLLDLDDDTIFDDDGDIQTGVLKSALEDLLERKPHLRATPNGVKPQGDPDAGKGTGAKDLESMSVDEHFQSIRRHKT